MDFGIEVERVFDEMSGKAGGGGRIRIDSALFIRVGDVPGRSNKDAKDDLGSCLLVDVRISETPLFGAIEASGNLGLVGFSSVRGGG